MTSEQNTASLINLPTEVHDMIMNELTIFDKHALRGTCRSFWSCLDPFISLDAPVTFEKLYEAAYTWDHARFKLKVEDTIKSRYVCTHCMRLLPRPRFADDAFCLHTKDLFCIRCGTLPVSYNPYQPLNQIGKVGKNDSSEGRKAGFVAYEPGSWLSIESQFYVMCRQCKGLHKGDARRKPVSCVVKGPSNFEKLRPKHLSRRQETVQMTL